MPRPAPVIFAVMLHYFSLIVFLAGAYSIIACHLIIIGEEKYLADRFKDEYNGYLKRLRRYL